MSQVMFFYEDLDAALLAREILKVEKNVFKSHDNLIKPIASFKSNRLDRVNHNLLFQ
jgi:hypothetical protein